MALVKCHFGILPQPQFCSGFSIQHSEQMKHPESSGKQPSLIPLGRCWEGWKDPESGDTANTGMMVLEKMERNCVLD
jgi:hypothetical protein